MRTVYKGGDAMLDRLVIGTANWVDEYNGHRIKAKEQQLIMEYMNGGSLQNLLENNIQNIEVVRFNPFKDEGMGGDQSFAISFLDKKGNGVIMSSLYSREKVSVFAKPILIIAGPIIPKRFPCAIENIRFSASFIQS